MNKLERQILESDRDYQQRLVLEKSMLIEHLSTRIATARDLHQAADNTDRCAECGHISPCSTYLTLTGTNT